MSAYRERCEAESKKRIRAVPTSLANWGFAAVLFAALGVPGLCRGEAPVVIYQPNPLYTTPFGPAKADILLRPANFLPCNGGPIALCYYSGPAPDGSSPDLSCEVTEDGEFANCRCVEIPAGPYYVDINSILDVGLYERTVRSCGKSGVDCRGKTNKAPVCKAINDGRLFAAEGAERISTFSFALERTRGFAIESTNCESALYAGCMTAPCIRSDPNDVVEICDDITGNCTQYPVDVCACPTFTGPYQVGKAGAAPGCDGQVCDCSLGQGEPGNNAWSAANNPLQDGTAPTPGCFPDIPGEKGCPLLAAYPDSDPPEPIIPSVPNNISCGKVCAEYRNSAQKGIEVGFTCDATLCTATGKDYDLVKEACAGLENGKISEIALLESEVGCSCCASQLCGCDPSRPTEREVYMLNQQQRDKGIIPQCDINGTLCGKP